MTRSSGVDGPNDIAVEEFLRLHGPSMFLSGGGFRGAHILGRRTLRFSKVVFARLDFEVGSREIVVKMVQQDPLAQGTVAESIRNEFDALRECEGAFSSMPDMGVVVPVSVYPEEGILVTQAFVGQSAHPMLSLAVRPFSLSASLREGDSLVRRCGRWLCLFQDAVGEFVTCKEHSTSDIQRLRDRLDVCTCMGFNREQAERIFRAAKAIANDLADRTTEEAAVHGDFAPWNILADEREMRVLDFTRFCKGSPSHDPAWFYCALETLKASLGVSARRVEQLQRAFLDELGFPVEHTLEFRYRLCLNAVELASWADRPVSTRRAVMHRLRELTGMRDGFRHLLDVAQKSVEGY